MARDHTYITSAYFWTFSDPPTYYVSINTVLNVSKNGHFLTPPTQSFCWRNIGMDPSVPSISLEVLDLSIQHMMSAFRFDYFPNFDPIVQSSFHHRFLIVFICSYIFSLQKYKREHYMKFFLSNFFSLNLDYIFNCVGILIVQMY